MAPRVARAKPALKQSSLQFGSRKSGKAADGKAKSSTTTPTPVATAHSTAAPAVEEVVHDSDIEEILAPEWEGTAMEHISEVDEPVPVTPSKRTKGKATAAKKGKGKQADEDEIEEIEEERPKKRRRVSSRTTKASVEIAADDEAQASTSKGAKGKRRQSKGKKRLSKSVFSSREGVENSESNKVENWAAESKIKITVKGSGKAAKHVDLPALRKHFGYVREKMGNVKPIHAKDQSMEDHILRFFDLSYEYGPCIGVTRLQRWERADALGLDPPQVVKQLLTNEDGSERIEVKECVFFGEVELA